MSSGSRKESPKGSPAPINTNWETIGREFFALVKNTFGD